MLSRINTPRLTGEVRVGLEVTISTEPCVSNPPRELSSGNLTRRISLPVTCRFVSPLNGHTYRVSGQITPASG